MARLGGYEILGTLDVGGMAEVLLARPLDAGATDASVVIKRILPELARKPEFVQNFLREARILARLRHPNVVAIQDLGNDEDGLYLVMDHVDGFSLAALSRALKSTHGRVDPAVATHVMAQLCSGLHAAHELSDENGRPLHIIHRDISPQNLMVTRAGDARLLDFGIAWDAEYTSNTATGHVKGKAEYMSPEQCRGDRIDRRTDLFSLGIVLYELTTQTRLFKRASPVLTMRAVCNDPVPYPSERVPAYPPVLEQLVMRALARDPAERFQTAAELHEGLLDAQAQLAPARDLRAETARLVASLPPDAARVDPRRLARVEVPTVAHRRPTRSSEVDDEAQDVARRLPAEAAASHAEDTLTSERELHPAPQRWEPPRETAPILPQVASRGALDDTMPPSPTPRAAASASSSASDRSGTVFTDLSRHDAPKPGQPSATELVDLPKGLLEARARRATPRLVVLLVVTGVLGGVLALAWLTPPPSRNVGGPEPRTPSARDAAGHPSTLGASHDEGNLDGGGRLATAALSTPADAAEASRTDAGDTPAPDGGPTHGPASAQDAGSSASPDAAETSRTVAGSAAAAAAAAATPTPPDRTVSIRVESAPPGAQVLLGGVARGQTPLELRLPYGRRPIELVLRRSGSPPAKHALVPDADQRVSATYPAKPKRPPPRRRPAPPAEAPRIAVERLPDARR